MKPWLLLLALALPVAAQETNIPVSMTVTAIVTESQELKLEGESLEPNGRDVVRFYEVRKVTTVSFVNSDSQNVIISTNAPAGLPPVRRKFYRHDTSSGTVYRPEPPGALKPL